MAGPGDPFTPGPTADPTAGIPDQGTFENIRNQWATFLDQPGARAALLQTGISLLSQPRFGENPASQIGRAIGAGAEAVSGGEMAQAKMQEMRNKAEVQAARAGQAETRIGLEHYRQQAITAREEANREQRLRGLYLADKKIVESQDQAKLKLWEQTKEKVDLGTLKPEALGPKPVPRPDMDFDTWKRVRFPTAFGGVIPSSMPRTEPGVAAAAEGGD